MKKMLKWALVVFVGGPMLLFFGAAVFVAAFGPDVHEKAEAIRAEKAAAPSTTVAAPIKAAAPAVDKAVATTAKAAACQVETDSDPFREFGQKLCATGVLSKVEISLEDGELSVLANFNAHGDQVFRGAKDKVFKTTRVLVDGVHAAAPRLTFVTYQMFDSTTTNIVGSCWHTRGVTRCKDYSGPTPKFVQ